MKSVWKYPLKTINDQIVTMPENAELLTVQVQQEQATLWALVETTAQLENQHIRIHGTGHKIEDAERLKYISTFQLAEGGLVFHVFEKVMV